MGNEYRKELSIQPDSGGVKIVIGTKTITHDLENKLSGFARPNKDGGNPVYKAFNINQVKETFEIVGILSDEIAETLIDDNSVTIKEDAKDKLVAQFTSTKLLRMQVKDLDRDVLTEDKTGFIEQISFEERSDEDASRYKVTVDFLRAEEQGS